MESNINKFVAFVTAAETGNFSEAATRLGYTQSTVSRMISGLEQDWHIHLFSRHGNYVTLTKEGAELLGHAQQICRDYRRLCTKVQDMQALEMGTLRIAASTSVIARKLPEPLGNFAHDFPHVKIQICECTYAQALKMLLTDETDIAFIPEPLRREGYQSHLYHTDEFVVVGPFGHFPASPTCIPITTLKNERFIADTETAPLLQQELTNTVQTFDTSDFTAILSMVKQGIGISLLPSLAVEGYEDELDIRHLQDPARRNIYVATHITQELPHPAQKFLTYLSGPTTHKITQPKGTES